MVKKIMTGLAISVGAGLALTVGTRTTQKKKVMWHPANNDGSMTPVTIRVHSAAPRREQNRVDQAQTSDHINGGAHPTRPEEREETMALTTTPERSAELAEIRVMIDALEQRSSEMMSTVSQRIDDLQNHLPRFIDVKVTSRIREVEERLRTEFQDEQSRTLDAFLRTLDQKVLPRISMLEEAVGAQGAEIGHMRKRIEKTDETLDRVLDRIEKVVDSMTSQPLPGHANSHVMEIHQKAVA
jgi:hypothetical protein